MLKIVGLVLLAFILSVIFVAVFFLLVKRGVIVINEITPNIDEIKEILRGNTAVSEYFSRILSSTIIGISIVIFAAVIISGLFFLK